MNEDLKQRTKKFALRIMKLHGALPKSTEAQVMGRQILRSGTSVGAHYHEASRSCSRAEFISKIEGGLQELEETIDWLELLVESQVIPETRLKPILQEACELNAILTTTAKTAKAKPKDQP